MWLLLQKQSEIGHATGEVQCCACSTDDRLGYHFAYTRRLSNHAQDMHQEGEVNADAEFYLEF